MSSKVNLEQTILEYKRLHPQCEKLSKKEVLSIMVKNGDIVLTEDQEQSLFSDVNQNDENIGLGIERETKVQCNFPKETEKNLKDVLAKRIQQVSEDTVKAEGNNSLVGKIWSWSKNNIPFLDKITDSSNEVREQQKKELEALKNKDLATSFKEITGLDYTEENVNNFLNDKDGKLKTLSEQALEEYKVGQEDSADFVSDMVSGGLSVAIYSGAIAAVVAAGAPFALAAGIAIGTTALVGAGTKIAVKKADAMAGDKEYKANGKDVLLGAVNGVLAPLTAGFGGKIASSVVGKLGGTFFKEGTELVAQKGAQEVAKKGVGQFVKEAMINPAGNVYKGSLGTKIAGYTTEMGIDGGLGGAGDAMTRTAYDGGSTEDILEAGLGGAVGGTIGAIGFGGVMKGLSNVAHKAGAELGGKINADSPEVKADAPEIKPDTGTPKPDTPELKAKDNTEVVANEPTTNVDGNGKKPYVSQKVEEVEVRLQDDICADTSGINIKNKVRLSKKEFEKILKEEKIQGWNGAIENRFKDDEINKILDLYNDFPDFIYKITTANHVRNLKYDGYYLYNDIIDLVELYKKNPVIVGKLTNIITNDGQNRVLFTDTISDIMKENHIESNLDDIIDLAKRYNDQKFCNYNDEHLISLATATSEEWQQIKQLIYIKDNNDNYIFDSYYTIADIVDLELNDSQFKEFLSKISELKDIKDIDSNYIPYFAQLNNDKINLVKEMSQMKNNQNKNRFTGHDMHIISSITDEELYSITKQLLFKKDKNNEFLYSPNFITNAIDNYKYNKDLTLELLNMRNSRGDLRFTYNNFIELKHLTTEEFDLFKKILNLKNQNQEYYFDTKSLNHIIETIPKLDYFFGENIDKFKKILTEFENNNITNYEILKIVDEIPNSKISDLIQIASIKNEKGDYIYSNEDILNLLTIFDKNKDFALSLIKAKNDNKTCRYTISDIISLVEASVIDKNTALKLSKMNDANGNYKFKDIDIKKLLNKLDYIKYFEIINNDGSPKYTTFMLKNIIEEDINPTVYDHIIEYAYKQKFDYRTLHYNSKNDLCISTDGQSIIHIFDNDGTIKRVINFIESDQNDMQIIEKQKKSIYRTSLINNEALAKNMSKEILDKNGNIIFKEEYIKSSDIEDKYDIIQTDKNGKSYKIGIAEISPSGLITIEKTLTSDSDIKTDYIYIEQPKTKEKINNIRITDKNGKIVEHKHKFKVIDDNHFISTENNSIYDIQYYADKVVVVKDNKQTIEIPIGTNENISSILSEDLLPLLKLLPGSVYFDIKNYNLKKIGKGIDHVEENNAHYCDMDNIVSVSEELSDSKELFVLLHELGHYIDYRSPNIIHENKKLIDIFNKEMNDFDKNSAYIDSNFIDYYIDQGLSEIIADTHAFLYSSNHFQNIEMRTQLLQKYFPKTFSYIIETIQNIKN